MTNKRAYIYEYQRRCICVRQHICPFTNLDGNTRSHFLFDC